MIGFLRGTLEAKSRAAILLDVEGVGYHVAIPGSIFDELPDTGSQIKMYTHLHVRENALDLYGFLSLDDRSVFLQLISVSDVGPKTAMNVLSAMKADMVREAIIHQDVQALTQIPGVGKKTAERLIVELKDKLGEVMVRTPSMGGKSSSTMDDAMAALVALGYSSQSVREAIRQIRSDVSKEMDAQEIIKMSLRHLS